MRELVTVIYQNAELFRKAVVWLLEIFVIHSTLYWLIGFFFTRKFRPAKKQYKYAICIAARNEENVIGNLLDSIEKQDYPKEKLAVFVIADNCTDQTAQIVRDRGAVCYERTNDLEKTKGYALRFLFEQIDKDFGIESFDGFFVFDADNLLNYDYVTKMNDAFDSGVKIITSYRNTKNFNENWIAASYGLHWLRSIRKNHRTRSFLRLATNIQGTGFLFANELVKDGWKYTSITEDRAFTADAVARGYEISYQDAAVFYDEQPTNLKVALRQRLRWSKGHLLAFAESGGKLLKHMVVGYRQEGKKRFTKEWLYEGIRSRLACFDTLAQLVPAVVIRTALWISVSLILYAFYRSYAGMECVEIFHPNRNLATKAMHALFGSVPVHLEPGAVALWGTLGLTILWRITSRIHQYIDKALMGIVLFFIERKRVIAIPWYKKVFYSLMWPTFDIIHRYTTYIALFIKVTWKPIPHTSKVTIRDLGSKTKK